jgi:hypothetical protein
LVQHHTDEYRQSLAPVVDQLLGSPRGPMNENTKELRMDAKYVKRCFVSIGTITLVLFAPLFVTQSMNPANDLAYAARMSTLKQQPPWAPLPGERPVDSYHYRYSEETSRSSSESAPAPTPNVAYRYYYYPRSQVFFDPDSQNYFYLLDRRWLKSTRLPHEIGPLDEDYVIIETDTDAPYTYHSQVLYMLANERKSASKAELPPPLWKPRGNDPVYRYLYYPDAFVYFDDDRGIYFYYLDGHWTESPTLPTYLTRQLGEPVRLSMNVPRPYQYHSDVLDRYSAQAAQVTASRPTFQIWSRTR